MSLEELNKAENELMARRRPRKSGARRGNEKVGWFVGLGIILSVAVIVAIVVNKREVPVLDPVTLCDQEKLRPS